MKKLLFTFCLFKINLLVFAQISALPFNWINNFGNTIICHDIKNDNAGNIYVCGGFSGTLVLNDTIITSIDTNSREIFLAKLDSTGNILWFRYSGGYGTDEATSLALDTINNSVYISGSFFKKINFESDTLFPQDGFNHFFLTKYDFDGNYLWSRYARRAGQMATTSTIALDHYENIILVSEQGSGNIIFQDTVVEASLSNGYFFVKYDSNGNRLAVKFLTEGFNSVSGNNLCIDSENNMVIFANGGAPITTDSIQYSCIMLIKYDSNGVYLWSNPLDLTSLFYPISHANSLTIDKSNNIYIVGEYFIDQGVTTSFFMYKVSSDGDLIWDKLVPFSYIASSYSTGFDILTFNDTSVFVTIYSTPSNYFGTDISSSGQYLAQFDSSGNLKNIRSYQVNNPSQLSLFFSIDKFENFYFGSIEISKVGRDYILSRDAINSLNPILIYPNPASNFIELKADKLSNNISIEIYNIIGKPMNIFYNKSRINIADLPNGVYLLKIIDFENRIKYQETFLKILN